MPDEPYPFDEFLEHHSHLMQTVRHYESVDIPTPTGLHHIDLPPLLQKSPEGLALQIQDYMAQVNEDPNVAQYKVQKLIDLLRHLVIYAPQYQEAGAIKFGEGSIEAPEYVWQILHMTLCSYCSHPRATPEHILPLIEKYRNALESEN